MSNIVAAVKVTFYAVFMVLFFACGSVTEELGLKWSKYIAWLGLGLWIFLISNYSQSAVKLQNKILGRKIKLMWNGWLPMVAMAIALLFILVCMAIEGRSHGAL